MRVVTEKLKLAPTIEMKMIDVTKEVQALLGASGMKAGQATVFVPGSTAAVILIEFEPGLERDMRDALERLIPKGTYQHNQAWADGNGFSHVRAAFLKPSVAVPFANGDLMLGQWQQIVFVELDNKKRERELVIQFIGE